MKHFTLCYFSSGGLDLPTLGQAVTLYRKNGGELTVVARTATQLFDQARIKAFVRDAMRADVVFLDIHGGKSMCPVFDPIVDEVAARRERGERTPYLHLQPVGGDEESQIVAAKHTDGLDTGNWVELCRYYAKGSAENFSSLFYLFHKILFDADTPVPPLRDAVQEGLYHPTGRGCENLDAYMRAHIRPGRPTVGIWFGQYYWINGNVLHIDALMREIEGQGANAIAVFSLRFKDKERGNKGADEIVDLFLKRDGKSVIDALVSTMGFSMTVTAPEYGGVLPGLDVPVLQGITSSNPYAVWMENPQGISTMDVSFQAAQPEFDGNLITVPFASREQDTVDPVTGGLLIRLTPIHDRVRKLASMAVNWAKLKNKPNNEKRVAVIFHHYPPRNDRIGCAAGLDSFASVNALLERMKEDGYNVERTFENGDALAKEMLGRMTTDRRWMTPGKMAERAEAVADSEQYRPWHEKLPEQVRASMNEKWGDMPGNLFVHEGRLLFPGFLNGNIFISIQPPRGYLENPEAALHDLCLPPPHHYLAFYRWIKYVFGADAVMHIGKHGSLEWLPGKALGLSGECYPDLSIMDLPNIYPYIINDPSEGTQAKRRSYCCVIDHLTPAFTNSDLYDEMASVEQVLAQIADAKNQDPSKLPVLMNLLWDAVTAADLHQDLDCTEERMRADPEAFIGKLHAYLSEIGDTMIADGLHTLGLPPDGERLVEFLAQLTRLDNGAVPSLRESIVSAMGYDYDDLLRHRGEARPDYKGSTGGQLIDAAHRKAVSLIRELSRLEFCKDTIRDTIGEIVRGEPEADTPRIRQTLAYIAETLVPNIRLVTEEIDASLAALAGRFVKPGPSGAPTRGQADILPTGRNFFSLDPRIMPTRAAWEVGRNLGDQLLASYLKEKGAYPESVGIIVWGGPNMRTKGDDVAEILYLMGLEPVWNEVNGVVQGLEVIPLDELKRPRIDVMPRISGFFRDAFPLLVELIDAGVRMGAALNENPESNFLRKNVLKDVQDYRREGKGEDEALRLATLRIFGCPPGTYGAGVAELIEAKNWTTQDDLGNNYIRYSAHAYGKGVYGVQTPETFKKHLSRMTLTVKNEDSREYDMMSCVDFYNYHGGLIAAVKSVRGELPMSMVGDSSDPRRLALRSTVDEAKHVLRSRILNPKWIEGLKRHGYKGAGDLSKVMDIVIGWDATAEVMEDWMYERLADRYALDPDMRKWLKEVNPHALQNILDKLLETISRGMWDTTAEMEEKLRDAYLEIEGEIEEAVG
ncbi:MAG: cobaltochelatase subunit CobN [Acidobacteriota bacterium]|jgi:cobaltochelatase CobN|nr:cobaltochelatase subunit CobN [Acidobacteriota bacterium]